VIHLIVARQDSTEWITIDYRFHGHTIFLDTRPQSTVKEGVAHSLGQNFKLQSLHLKQA
jgi:hypothetical protein